MTVTIISIIAISVAAAIGAVIGIFKKATGLSFWGAIVLLSAVVALLVAKFVPTENGIYAWLMLGVTVGAIVLFICFFGWLKKFLEKRIKNAREYSHYKNKDKVDESEAYILNAVDGKNKKQYRKLRRKRRKIKDSSGAWGVINRLLGFIAGGLDWLVAVGSICCIALIFVEVCGIGVIQDNAIVQELLTSSGWVNLGSKFAIDILIIGTLVIAIRSGFNRGIFHLITPIVVIAMLAGFGYSSWAIASSSVCEGIVTSLKDGLLVQLTSINADLSAIVAKVIITGVIFLLSLILVIITGIYLPKLLDKFRDNDAFYVLDGVLGAVFSLALLLAVYVALGGIAYTLNDLAFMSKFNSYEAQSAFANCFYAFNPLASVFANVPIRFWFTY
ncbi:MAG: hypothetical protein ACI4MB_03480 [Candidatus Coproplasma sp.]